MNYLINHNTNKKENPQGKENEKQQQKSIWNLPDKTLSNLICCRKGGKTTLEIIQLILEQPYNKNQIASKIQKDYKTVSYHTDILCKHKYIKEKTMGKRYYYIPTKKILNNLDEFKFIKEHMLNREDDNHEK